MLAALTFFILVVLFIAKQRIIDRGLLVAFWWTRFLPMPGPVISGGKEGSVRGVLEDVIVDEGRNIQTSSRATMTTTAVETLVQTLGESKQSSLAIASASLAETASALPEETPTFSSILESIVSSVTEQMSHSESDTSTVLLHSEL